jgi:hypothetical protein
LSEIRLKFHLIEWDSYYMSKFQHHGEATHVLAEIDGELFPLTFYEPEAIARATANLKEGTSDFAIPNILVVAKISMEEMHRVVRVAHTQGFFRYLLPISKARLDSGDTNWLPCLPDGTWV